MDFAVAAPESRAIFRLHEGEVELAFVFEREVWRIPAQDREQTAEGQPHA